MVVTEDYVGKVTRHVNIQIGKQLDYEIAKRIADHQGLLFSEIETVFIDEDKAVEIVMLGLAEYKRRNL